ncbi:hypothetical protein EGW08_006881 [Elysia chlorotica]|uniref:Lipid-binding serum glycoprotein N-terminal domain-containing protein n=1 Tax=Elysia chlorotica TaxID=188477 RepID=A0A3S0ZTA7_ELYCH|nr:hypothetical protein EGW08_006881 [Elysia chlorotica]
MAVQVALLFILALVELCASGNPRTKHGYTYKATKNVVQFASETISGQVNQKLQALGLPNQSGREGDVIYNLTNIKIKKVSPPRSSISLVPEEKGIYFGLKDFDMSVDADWQGKYKKGWLQISSKGKVNASLSGISLVETASLDVDESGKPQAYSGGCSFSIGKVDLDFQGNNSIVTNLFRGPIEEKVREIMQRRICEEVVDVVNKNTERTLAGIALISGAASVFLGA